MKPDKILGSVAKKSIIERNGHVLTITWFDKHGERHKDIMHCIHGGREANAMCELLRKIQAQARSRPFKSNTGESKSSQSSIAKTVACRAKNAVNDDD